MRFRLFTVILLVVLAGLSSQAHASSIVPPRDLGELALLSDAVVLARAQTTEPFRQGRAVWTRTSFIVLETVHAPADATLKSRFVVESEGGVLDGYGWAVAGSPSFESGTTYLLFLRRTDRGTWQPRLLAYGLLRAIDGTDGTPLLTHLDAAHRLHAVDRPDGIAVEPVGTYRAAPLLHHLRGVAAGTVRWQAAAALADPNLLPAAVHGSAHKTANGIPEPCTFFTSADRPARWNTPGDPSPITLYAEATGDLDFGTSTSHGTVAAGLSQWTGIPGIDLNVDYGGTRAYTPACSGGSATATLPSDLSFREGLVQFNDPCEEIGDFVGGTGVLAQGGAFFTLSSSDAHEHRTMNWNTALIGFVVFNNGVADVLDEAEFEIVMAHEIGHLLGFGHIAPLDGTALMNPSCCNNLTTIDEACALFAYSDGAYLAPPPVLVPLSPAPNATGQPTTPTFRWQPEASSAAYDLQVSTTSSFNSLAASAAELGTTEHALGPLAAGTTYYWRVRGSNEAGKGPWSNPSAFTTTLVAPGATTLVAPGLDDVAEPGPVVLQWQAAEAAVGHALQVASNDTFSDRLVDEEDIRELSYTLDDLAQGSTYHWRVRGINASGEGPWVSSRFRTAKALPGVVTLQTPNNGAVNQTAPLALAWAEAVASTTYEVQVSTTPDFSRLVAERNATEPTTTLSELDIDQTYHWRVRGRNASGPGPWSASFSFTTLPAPPATVELGEPEDGVTVQAALVSFIWASLPGAERYDLQVARDDQFVDLVADEAELTRAVRTLGPFEPGTRYYWRVRATNAAGPGVWSATRTFSTEAPPPSFVTLRLPVDGAEGLSGLVDLTWDIQPLARAYHLQIAQDPDFADLVLDADALSATTFQAGPLTYATTHYWRVRASNEAGAGPWSDPRTFTTAVGTAVEPLDETAPAISALHPAYPNPFAYATALHIDLAEPGPIRLVVYDLQGRTVAVLADRTLPAGRFTVHWNAGALPSGTYLIRLEANGFTQTHPAVVVR